MLVVVVVVVVVVVSWKLFLVVGVFACLVVCCLSLSCVLVVGC
jgi:hypothetical protein